jgi:predicted metalloprotease with PDZ domain
MVRSTAYIQIVESYYQEILIVSTLVGFHIPARNKDQVLDLVLTNMFQYMAVTM